MFRWVFFLYFERRIEFFFRISKEGDLLYWYAKVIGEVFICLNCKKGIVFKLVCLNHSGAPSGQDSIHIVKRKANQKAYLK